MTIRKLVIPGKPLGKQRVRVPKRGRPYTPDQTVNYEAVVKALYIEKYGMEKPLEGPVMINIVAFYQIPKSASKARQRGMKDWTIRPTVRPDIDNVLKIITDALNGVAYLDDKQIIECSVNKCYAEAPAVLVTISELNAGVADSDSG
jgi:Holliday junction resolvase RusA-like endonuclease